MSVKYQSIFPLAQRDSYLPEQTVDFVLSLDNEAVVPASVQLEGKLYAYSADTTPLVGYNDICYDPKTGFHSAIREITTQFERGGVVENLTNYPRLVKALSLCTGEQNSFGTQTSNAVEGFCANPRIAKAYLEGPSTADRGIPFSLKLRNVLNSSSGPLAFSQTGQIRIRIRLASNLQFFYGSDVTSATNYALQDLRLRFQTTPDTGKFGPVNLTLYSSFNYLLDSAQQNVSVFVQGGPADAVHITTIKNANENDYTKNYNACEPVPGLPPLGFSGTSYVGTSAPYGFERVYYAVNDTDTALVGFAMESREEILLNGIRSFNPALDKYNTLLRLQEDPGHPDGYVAGIPFGGFIDLSRNKFAAELRSQCSTTTPYSAYFHFRQTATIGA